MKIEDMLKELMNGAPVHNSHVTIVDEDGNTRECDAEKWAFFGLSRKNKVKISWGRVIAVGGEDQVADLILLIAMMTSRARDLARNIVNAVPRLNEETLSELVEAAMETLEEVDEDA